MENNEDVMMPENEDIQIVNEEEMEPPNLEITTEYWVLRLKNVDIRKEVVNRIVMNFLVAKGYQEAVEKFQKESGTEPDVDRGSITDRVAVVEAIECGNLEDAIEFNGLNPEMPETNCLLIQQMMIELIRKDNTDEALAFAQNELKSFGEQNQEFLDELEKPIALLCFIDPWTCPVKELLNNAHRFKTANEVNKAIYESQSGETGPKLEHLLKMLIWIQNQLDEKVEYPRITLY